MKKKILKPENLLDHQSGLRKLEAESSQREYVSFSSLDEARRAEFGVVILEGDDGGQIYVVCPARLVKCDEDALQQLLCDIDACVWNDPTSTRLCYEKLPPGSGVAGGMGGGLVQDSIWVHPKLKQLGLLEGVKRVIDGRTTRLDNIH